MAYRYGVSDAVDAWHQFTMTMATWLPRRSGVLSVVLIPVLVRSRADQAEKHVFISELQGLGGCGRHRAGSS